MFHALFGVIKAVFIAIGQFLFLACKLIYRVLKFLHIRILTLYVLVCAVLSAFLPIFGEGIAYFWAGFALCCVATAIGWFFAIRRKLGARPRDVGKEEKPQEAPAETAPTETPPAEPLYPRYFDVAGAPQYFFAEYEDRYELYRREESGYTYVRTDKKL